MTRRALLTLLLIGILLAACAPPEVPTQDIQATIAANAETMVAAIFQTQTALAPTVTNTALPTVTPLASSTALSLPLSSPTVFVAQPVFLTPTPTGTFYTATTLASSLGVGCNNLRLVESFTSPQGPFVPGQKFTQSWQVENNGTCDWVYLYHLVHASGERLGGSPGNLSKVIPPYKWTTLSVDLTAPNNTGTYKGSWRFTNADGTPFGAVLPVNITVGGSTNTPKPPTATPNLAQTANAANTAVAAQQQTATAACAVTPNPPASPIPPCQ